MGAAEKNMKPLDEAQLRTFFHTAFRSRDEADSMAARRVRTRILLVCLLSRHAGMRISEALQFRDERDLDEEGNVHVHGRWERTVPLSTSAAGQIRSLCADPCLLRDRGCLCRMDQGYARRTIEALGRGLGIRVNPSVLRRTREAELLRMGVPSSLADRFMGNAVPEPDARERQRMRSLFRTWEASRRVGRHNTFRGVIKTLEKSPFTCLAGIDAGRGLRMEACCTLRALDAMGLEAGSEVMISFRSLQVEFLGPSESGPGGMDPPGSASASKGQATSRPGDGRNIFSAVVDEVWKSGGEAKVLASLPGGSIALILREGQNASPGQRILIRIAPEAVEIRPLAAPAAV